MKRTLLSLLALCVCLVAGAQNDKPAKGTTWTDGDTFYEVSLVGSHLNLCGGSLHEGGDCFGLTPDMKVEKGFFAFDHDITRAEMQDGYCSLPVPLGTRAELVSIGTNNNMPDSLLNKYLLFYSSKGEVVYALQQFNDNLYCISEGIMRRRFRGEYRLSSTPAATYDPVHHDADNFFIGETAFQWGNVDGGLYNVGTDYDMPSNVFYLDDCKTGYRIKPSREGINVYETKQNDYEDWEDGPLLFRLILQPYNGEFEGRWYETFHRVMLPEELASYSKEELRLMRNEIFARHGYIFKSKDLQDYFAKQQWYQPFEADLSRIHLSQAEAVNVELIKTYENRKADRLPAYDE